MRIKYKGYVIRVAGLSHYIYRPGENTNATFSAGYTQSLAAAKRWINADLDQGPEK